MNLKKLLIFLALTFGVSGFAVYWILNKADGMGEMIFFSLLYLWAPGIAAWLTQKAFFSGSMKEYGFRSGKLNFSWMMGSVFAPLGVILGTLGVIFLLGNVLHLPGFGKVVLGAETGNMGDVDFWHPAGYVAVILKDLPLFSDFFFSSVTSVVDLLQMLFTGILLGIFIGGPIMLLPEIGWRGFLLRETQSKGFLGGGLLTGLGWSAWALLPFIMTGYFDLQVWAIVAANLVSLSFLLSYLSLKCGNIVAPVLFRGVLGTIGGITFLFVKDADPMMASIGGVAGTVFFMFVTYLILINDKGFVQQFPSLVYWGNEEDVEN